MEQEKLGRIILIHGVKSRNSKRSSMRRLAPAFKRAGFCVVTPRYGFIPAALVGIFQWIDNRIAESMSAFIHEDDIILGHSNGATLAYLISLKVPLRGVILVNAALDSKKIPVAKFVHVYFNQGDLIAGWSALVPFHPWGDMGKVGYRGKWEPHVVNVDQGNPPNPDLPPLDGHTDLLRIGHTRPWSKYMAELAASAVQRLNRMEKKS